MLQKRCASMSFIVAFGSALLLAACGAAAKTPRASESAAIKMPTAGGTVHVISYSNSDGARSSVILTGAIGDFGQAVSQHQNGTIDFEHNAELNLVLSKGSFAIAIVGLDEKIVSAFNRLRFNTTTCSGNVSVTGVTPIVQGSGTGSYSGIRGSFDLTVTIAEVVPKSRCNLSATFLAQAIVITGLRIVSFN